MKGEEMDDIIKDKREIQRIVLFTADKRDEECFSSREQCKIEAYHENGDMAPIVWFNIIRNGAVIAKVNSRYVSTIEY